MPQFGGASEKCNVCSKTVYLAEKIVVEDKEDKKTFHKTCLKCTHCKVTLNLGNYASMNGVMYCKPHFKQLFATKGNYDEGFGKEKLTSKWEPQAAPAPASNSFVPVTNTSETSASTSSSDGGKKETPSSIAAKFQKSSTASEKCDTCGKTVYATERIVIEEKDGKKVFHKGCLKCTHCKVVLSLGNYASMNGITYCKPHFKQLFATKGNYDEGFGKEKATSKWDPQVNTAPTTFVPVTSDEPVKSEKKADPTVTSKFGNASEKCTSCGKTVYLTEKIVVEDKDDKQVFHKSCLRCTHCQIVLTLGNYASMKGVMYCKPHFKQLFAAKGNYEEGFGKEKVTAKWTKEGESEEEPRSEESPAQTRYHEEEPKHEETHHHHEEEPKHEEEPPRHHEEEHRHHEEEPKHEESHHHEEESHHHHEEEHHHHHDEEHEHSHDHNDDHHHHHDGDHEHHHHEEEHHHHHEEEERREEEVAEEEKRDDE